MCEDRVLRLKKGTHLTRARAARRLLRVARVVTPPTPPPSVTLDRTEDADTTRSSPAFRYNPNERTCSHNGGCRRREGLLDIALRTVALMRRNKQLQIRLAALQAETTAFIKSVMNNPENRRRQNSEATSGSSGPSSLSSESTQDSNSGVDDNVVKEETTDVKPMK